MYMKYFVFVSLAQSPCIYLEWTVFRIANTRIFFENVYLVWSHLQQNNTARRNANRRNSATFLRQQTLYIWLSLIFVVMVHRIDTNFYGFLANTLKPIYIYIYKVDYFLVSHCRVPRKRQRCLFIDSTSYDLSEAIHITYWTRVSFSGKENTVHITANIFRSIFSACIHFNR